MTKENKKLRFRDISWVLKIAVIAGWAYLALIVLNIVSIFMNGGF
jgi:hypothetical protein